MLALCQNNKEGNYLFWLTVSEFSVYGLLAALLWPVVRQNTMVEGCDGAKLFISCQPRSKKSKRATGSFPLSSFVTSRLPIYGMLPPTFRVGLLPIVYHPICLSTQETFSDTHLQEV